MRFTISALTSVLAGCVSVSEASRIVLTDRDGNEETPTIIRHEVAASSTSSHDDEQKKRGKENMFGVSSSSSSSFSKVKETDVYKKLRSRLMPNKLKNSVLPTEKAVKCVLPTKENRKKRNHNLDFGALDEDDKSHRNCSSKGQVCVDPTVMIGAHGVDELSYSNSVVDSNEETVGICVDRASVPDSYWEDDMGSSFLLKNDRRLQDTDNEALCAERCPERPVVEINGYDLHNQVYYCLEGDSRCKYAGVDINCWDTSKVTDMYFVFADSAFQGDLNCWDTTGVTNMNSMFYGAYYFNGNIDTWDTSSCTDMRYMFDYAKSFNRPIGNWNVSNVNNMTAMFKNTFDNVTLTGFDQDLGNWTVDNVLTMYSMFESSKFNQNLDAWKPINVEETNYMFYGSKYFDSSLKKFGKSLKKCTDMKGMFEKAEVFSGGNLKNWKTPKVENMDYMFSNAYKFKGKGIEKWDVKKVTSMYAMFYNAKSFEQKKLKKWKTNSVTDMASMFENATNFKDNTIFSWNVEKVEFFDSMFENAPKFKGKLDQWRPSSLSSASYMFFNSKFNSCLSTWAAKVNSSSFSGSQMFDGSDCPDTNDPVANVGPWCQTAEQSCFAVTFADTCGDGADLAPKDQRCKCKDIKGKAGQFEIDPTAQIKCKKVKKKQKCDDPVEFLQNSEAYSGTVYGNFCAKTCGTCFNWN